MRQRVGPLQLAVLSPREREYLAAWRNRYQYPERLSIGQLMHFLTDHGDAVQIQRNVSDELDSPIDTLWRAVAAKVNQLAQAHPPPAVRDLEAKWNEWKAWLEVIDRDFTNMLLRRQMWRVMVETYNEASEESALRRYGGAYMTWLAGLYVDAQASGVRRHADTRDDVVTLKRTLEDMQIHHDVMEKYSPSPTTLAEIQHEIEQLDQLAEAVIYYANKQVAHLAPETLEVTPTFRDLNQSVDQLFRLMHQCNLIVAGSDLQPEVIDASGWQEILYHPWKVDPDSIVDDDYEGM